MIQRSQPGQRQDSATGTAAAFASGHAPPTRFSNRALRECPLKRGLGQKRAAFGGALHPKIGLRRHVRSRPTPHTLQANIPRSFGARGQGASWTRGPRLHRGAGSAFVPERPLGDASRSAQMPTGLPRGARCGLLSRRRGRPPACHRRGRSPHNQPTSDHADGATLGRRDA
jgi:hypothetical protein